MLTLANYWSWLDAETRKQIICGKVTLGPRDNTYFKAKNQKK